MISNETHPLKYAEQQGVEPLRSTQKKRLTERFFLYRHSRGLESE